MKRLLQFSVSSWLFSAWLSLWFEVNFPQFSFILIRSEAVNGFGTVVPNFHRKLVGEVRLVLLLLLLPQLCSCSWCSCCPGGHTSQSSQAEAGGDCAGGHHHHHHPGFRTSGGSQETGRRCRSGQVWQSSEEPEHRDHPRHLGLHLAPSADILHGSLTLPHLPKPSSGLSPTLVPLLLLLLLLSLTESSWETLRVLTTPSCWGCSFSGSFPAPAPSITQQICFCLLLVILL